MIFSVVIITKNEENNIKRTLKNLEGVSDDVIIVDSGSTDDTLSICGQFNCKIIGTEWKGYGETKNVGNNAAKYDWILSIDADESIDDRLKQFLSGVNTEKENTVFKMKRRNFFCQKPIRYGGWADDKTIRLFNRKNTKWNSVPVHENLEYTKPPIIEMAEGFILHYTYNTEQEYLDKMEFYARLNAEKYFSKKKKAGFVKMHLSPTFKFVKDYFFKRGFLDGKYGFLIAQISAKGIKLKYKYLRELNKSKS